MILFFVTDECQNFLRFEVRRLRVRLWPVKGKLCDKFPPSALNLHRLRIRTAWRIFKGRLRAVASAAARQVIQFMQVFLFLWIVVLAKTYLLNFR